MITYTYNISFGSICLGRWEEKFQGSLMKFCEKIERFHLFPCGLSQSPILIIHGTSDQKAPVSLAKESYKQLNGLKMPVTLILLPEIDHDVDPQGLEIAGEFLKDCLFGKIVDWR